MGFEEGTKALFERANALESEEGTIKLEYVISDSDQKEFASITLKRCFIMLAALLFLCVVGVVVSALLDQNVLVEACAIVAALIVFIGLFLFLSVRSKKNNSLHVNNVRLAFNVKGVVMRSCCDVDYAVYAYDWNEFDSITEYNSMAVGLVGGLAFIFPKRAFTAEEFETFRRFSFNAIGKKCVYKNFKLS